MTVENLLGKVKETAHEIRLSQPTRFKRQRVDDDVEIVKVQAARKRIKHNKFFQFEEDRRPRFFGVQKLPFTSSRVSGRRPFEKDYSVFNSDMKSDDECECAIGESLSGSEHEPEDGEPKRNEYRYDGWLCGDERIEWIEEDDEEQSDFGRQDEADDDGMMDEEHDKIIGKIFKPKQKANTAFYKTEATFRLVNSVPEPDSNLRNYKAQALVLLPYVIGKPFESECFAPPTPTQPQSSSLPQPATSRAPSTATSTPRVPLRPARRSLRSNLDYGMYCPPRQRQTITKYFTPDRYNLDYE